MKQRQEALLLALPLVLFLTTATVFLSLASWLGKETGYLLGFLFYWAFWCLFIPRLILGKTGSRSLVIDRMPLFARSNWLAALLFLVVTGVTLIMYLSGFLRASRTLILLAIPCATVNGLCEEMLWRGVYVRSFPGNPWLAIFYPALGFAVWHFVP